MSFGTAYATKKRMAKGGEVEHHSPAGGSANRAKGAARVRNEDHVAGVHKSDSVYSPGSSKAGYNARAGHEGPVFNKQAKDEHKKVLGEMNAMPKPKLPMYEGGEVEEMGEYDPMENPQPKDNEAAAMEDADMIARIMHKRKMYAEGGEAMPGEEEDDSAMSKIPKFSKGGRVANDVGVAEADKDPAEFDDLVLDDHLEDDSSAGNEHGDADQDERDGDVIAKIMKSRKKKDRMPRPA